MHLESLLEAGEREAWKRTSEILKGLDLLACSRAGWSNSLVCRWLACLAGRLSRGKVLATAWLRPGLQPASIFFRTSRG